jgi:hypothetical protein
MTSKLKTDVLETVSGSGTIALTNQLSGMTSASVPSGSVIQVVQGTYATSTVIATATYTDSGLSATITPSSTSSKILVMWTTHAMLDGSVTRGWGCKLMRNTTAVYTDAQNYRTYGDPNTGDLRLTIPISHLDSPSTTSAITYKVQVSAHNGYSTTFNQANSETQITLMEIKG